MTVTEESELVTYVPCAPVVQDFCFHLQIPGLLCKAVKLQRDVIKFPVYRLFPLHVGIVVDTSLSSKNLSAQLLDAGLTARMHIE